MQKILFSFLTIFIVFLLWTCDEEPTKRESTNTLTCDLNNDGKESELEKSKCSEKGNPCDADGDGKVTSKEKDSCKLDCDLNNDGKVTPLETGKCNEAFPECDKDSDGKVTLEEKQSCSFTCDLNGDKKTTEFEKKRCANGVVECDLDANGFASEEEKTTCKEKGLEHDLDGDQKVTDSEIIRSRNGIADAINQEGQSSSEKGDDGKTTSSETTNKKTPVYITIVSHNEDDSRYDGYDTKDGYLGFRKALLDLAELIVKYEAKWDVQVDWRFLKAVQKYDTGDVLANTDQKNIVKYLDDIPGIRIEAHSHEGNTYKDANGQPLPESEQHNYADVVKEISLLGVEVPPVIGGAIYFPLSSESIWDRFLEPQKGNLFPDFTWTPQILWGVGTYKHSGEEDSSSGIWQPKSKEDFFTHDPNGNLYYVGGSLGVAEYDKADGIVSPVKKILTDVESGEAPAGKFYAATSMIFEIDYIDNQSKLDNFEEKLKELQSLANEGKVIWAHLDEMVEIWKDKYSKEANVYDFCDLHEYCENHLRKSFTEVEALGGSSTTSGSDPSNKECDVADRDDPCDMDCNGTVTAMESKACKK